MEMGDDSEAKLDPDPLPGDQATTAASAVCAAGSDADPLSDGKSSSSSSLYSSSSDEGNPSKANDTSISLVSDGCKVGAKSVLPTYLKTSTNVAVWCPPQDEVDPPSRIPKYLLPTPFLLRNQPFWHRQRCG